MDQPKGLKVAGKENQVCLLKKAIYGLKKIGQQWHALLHGTLEELSFHKLALGDTSIFIKHHDGGEIGSILLILLVYVDNIAIFGTLTDINVFKMQIFMKCI